MNLFGLTWTHFQLNSLNLQSPNFHALEKDTHKIIFLLLCKALVQKISTLLM